MIVLNQPKIVLQAFLACENILHLATRYSHVLLENACAFVLGSNRFVGYGNIKNAITTKAHSGGTDTAAASTTASSPGADQRIEVTEEPEFEFTRLRGFDAFVIPIHPVTEEV